MLLPVRQSAATGDGLWRWELSLHPLPATPALHPLLHMLPSPQMSPCITALLGSQRTLEAAGTVEALQPCSPLLGLVQAGLAILVAAAGAQKQQVWKEPLATI